MQLYDAPRVTLVHQPLFMEPRHLPVHWEGDASQGAAIVEYGGRLCYMSQHNPAHKSTEAYVETLLAQGHGSVLEHATYGLLIEQVSRSLTHELVRHRAGMAYSQLSQRYVDSSTVGFVIPPAVLGRPELEELFEGHCASALEAYERLAQALEAASTTVNATQRRKEAREAAREVLPNAAETKILVTGNVRAWRHILELRGASGASMEMQRLMRAILPVLNEAAPELFADIEDTWPRGGIVVRCSKV